MIPRLLRRFRLPRSDRVSAVIGLPLLIACTVLVAVGGVALLSFRRSSEQVMAITGERLEVVAQNRATLLDDYLTGAKQQLAVLAGNPSTLFALTSFTSSYMAIEQNAYTELQQQFGREAMAAKAGSEHPDGAEADSLYEASHKRFDAGFRQTVDIARLADLYLINELGDIVYSVQKQRDFGAVLSDSMLAGSGLSRAHSRAMAATAIPLVTIEDYAPYAPLGEPALFMARSVRSDSGRLIGTVVFRISNQTIDHIMQAPFGLGETGDAILVGADGLARSNSRWGSQLPAAQRFTGPAMAAALAGSSGVVSSNNHLGHAALLAYRAVMLGDERVALLVSVDRTEAFASVYRLGRELALTAAGILAAIVLIGIFYARSIIRRIQFTAHHDPLTGLPNRRLFNDRLAQAIAIAGRGNQRVAVLCLDLDQFKPVNELLGHSGGDKLLLQVGARLTAILRETDTVARLGGDEFVVILPLIGNLDTACGVAERIIDELSRSFEIDGEKVTIGSSVGIAMYPMHANTAAKLMLNADTALYRAKHGGRGTFRVFDAAMDLQMQERRLIEYDLRGALERGEMSVHYQPLVSCLSGELEGFEALVRWHHPQRGPISPGVFIPIAEESGMIVPLGRWILETACAEAVRWPKPYRLAVNVSPVQFRKGDLAGFIADTLDHTGLAPERLEIEVTEGLLIEDTGHALTILAAMKHRGIRISLDDFGTGYSSLSYLHRFPFDSLKIDRSFVCDMDRSEQAVVVIRSIIALAHSLHLTLTAEGVETQAQLDLLRELNCDQAQGYLLGRPMSAQDLDKVMGEPRKPEGLPQAAA